MKSAVLVFPGINRERDMARALKLASGNEAAMVWHAETSLPKGTDLVVVPGGFSYGDYLRCGAIAARAPVMDAVRGFARDGGLVLGVCNGFQILCESELLPGVLMRNARLKFVCRDVHMRVERSDTPFTRGYNAGQVIRVPVAHGEGNYEADEETLKRLEGDGRVLYRYCSPEGVVDEPANFNGAAHAIAGIVNERGNVLGMMPHPENHVEDIMGCTDGRGLFAGLVAHLEKSGLIGHAQETDVPQAWNDIAAFYRDLVHRGMQIQGMLHLTEQIEASPYSAGIFGETSMHDLCVMQTSGAFWEGPYLRISPRFDGTIEFRYIDTQVVARQWHRVVREDDAFGRLVGFFDQLHWFAKSVR